ncbi:MAG: hypothetical protein Q7T72_12780 [Bacteroidales bacterium]|nr:hypothetical protein [Bacteroidales bacterium]
MPAIRTGLRVGHSKTSPYVFGTPEIVPGTTEIVPGTTEIIPGTPEIVPGDQKIKLITLVIQSRNRKEV